jgi:hypothetical protein
MSDVWLVRDDYMMANRVMNDEVRMMIPKSSFSSKAEGWFMHD